ncbi:acyl-CoA desaturase [Sulfurimonas sp. SAG-AH-194-I05]|nr:acyl-CoA desaturase [Sulfurimonas sp. SAG-AH-194-I05]MDF1874751.1 acyl-CoA desaturase [Sulfurimonas sp. SAG-AH-194-I05]
MANSKYPDIFDELKSTVRAAGLLERTPLRGSVEMAATIFSMIIVYAVVYNWNIVEALWWAPFALAFFMVIIFTRAVFISHDLLHTQYFKSKSLAFKSSYPFSAFILSNSSSWWDWKHNINHHTFCNIPQKDEDIRAMDGAFTNKDMGDKAWLRSTKYVVFWGAMFFMYPAFIAQSYSFVLSRKKYGELALMLLHWPIVWGPVFYFLPIADALRVFITLNIVLSAWLAFGFITNHLGCEVIEEEDAEGLSWMELQMRTSRSLKGGFLVHWFYGGLNTQIEHHLFPKAPRFHLLKVQKMTKDFAKKHNIEYFETTPLRAYIQINDVLKKY